MNSVKQTEIILDIVAKEVAVAIKEERERCLKIVKSLYRSLSENDYDFLVKQIKDR